MNESCIMTDGLSRDTLIQMEDVKKQDCMLQYMYVVNLVSLQTDYVSAEVLKYLYAKCVDVSVGQMMDFFVSEPKFASSYVSKSVLVFGPVSVEVQGSVETVH